MAMKFVVCIDKSGLGDFSGDDLTIGHNYLYPASCFEAISLTGSAAHRLHDALAQKVEAGRASMHAGRGRSNDEVEAEFAARRAGTASSA